MVDFATARQTMVDRQIRTADVTERRVLSAFGEVPREDFVPVGIRALAYSDAALPLRVESWGERQRHLLEPAVLARLLQLAEIKDTDIVLDVGCATGYSSAVLSRLGNSVVALESDADLAAQATETLIDLGIGNVAVVEGDLEAGYAAEAPYDVIILGGSVDFVPAALTDQLRDGGRLVAIVGRGQSAMATIFRRTGTEVAHWTAFNVPAWPLPGFIHAPSFAF